MVHTYECPSCGAGMTFDAKTQMLHCSHCDREQSVADYMQAHPLEADPAPDADDSLQVFTCPSCGAQLITDAYTAATTCAYCKSPVVLESRLDGKETPDAVLPFGISREDAKEKLRAWAKSRPLAPLSFSKEGTLEQMEGMYVPYWMYCYDIRAQVTADCTRTRRTRRGNTEYIHTDHFRVGRDVRADYERIPADASKKMPDEVMEQLEPYAYQQLAPFAPAYLSGFQAEKRNFESVELESRAHSRAEQYALQLARESIQGYGTVQIMQKQIDAVMQKAEYALLPVWCLQYRYMGKDYSFYMNGQTGRIVGELPVSIGRTAAWFLGAAGIVFVIAFLIMTFMGV